MIDFGELTVMNAFDLKVCDVQGRLFELSAKAEYNSEKFIKSFMKSEVAKHLGSSFNHMQWAGEEYLLAEIADSAGEVLCEDGQIFSKDVLYWIGYIYRYWHYHTGEESAKIYKQAPVKTMVRNFMMFHTMDPVMAIENLKEIYSQKK